MIRKKIAIIFCTVFSVLIIQVQSFGQTTFKSGSAIIDMGSASPTVKNSLKPYGLIYALLKNNHVPVSCVVNASKTKDGIDFVYNGKSYRGGTFIVPADYITSAVSTVLNNWAGQGVVIDYTTASAGDLTATVTYTTNFVPQWVMDKTNGNIAVAFLQAAGIPASGYSFKTPSQLGGCDDIFILPHADPTWATHNNLYFWNKNNKGALWVGCHAVSVLESLSKDTTISGTPTTLKMNFLTSGGLIPFTDHNPTSTPFSNFLPGDPVAQFISKTDNAQLGGSETVYLPKSGSTWNAGAKILTTSPSQGDVPSLSAGAAVENVYGRAFDNAANGYVAYEASHNVGGSSSDQIAAQRIFFNFSFFALNDKVPPIINISLTGVPSQLTAGTTSATLTAANSGTGSVTTYQWSATVAGTFSSATSGTTTFTPSTSITSATTCIITCVATESCGRVSFDSKTINIIPQNPPLSSANITKSIPDGCVTGSVTFNVFDSNVDANAGTRTLVDLSGLANGTVSSTTGGSITFTSTANYKGTTSGTYTISNGITTSTGNISITVGTQTLAPSITDDAASAILNSVTVINVLNNDKNNSTATLGDSLYIRDITSKPGKGYVYINSDGTLSYLSKNAVSGTDNFQYLACNKSGYCSSGTVTITLVDNCGTGKYQSNQTLTPITSIFNPSADSYLDQSAANTNRGSSGTLSVFANTSAQSRPVVKFNLSSLPTTSLITEATLSLTASASYITDATSGGANTLFPLNVNAFIKGWVESEVTYNTASVTPAVSWTTAGATSTAAGGDITNTGSSTFPFIANVSASAGDAISSGVKTIVTNWVSGSLTNNGFFIRYPATKTTAPAMSFYSKEGTTDTTKQPRLAIKYYPCLTTPTTYSPIVYPDAATTSSALSVTISPLSNDVNYYSNTNALSSVTTPANGTATISGNQIIYTPSGSFAGVDTLTYTVKDQTNNATSTATIRITVSRAAPSINADFASTNSNTAVTIVVDTNDKDLGGTVAASPVITISPKNGTATVDNSNRIVYTPSTGFTGKDSLVYKRVGAVSDACSTALSDTALVVITVNNQAPVAVNDTVTAFACAPLVIKVKANDTDPEGAFLRATVVTNPTNGTVTANADGTLTYSPNANYIGADQFTYSVRDTLAYPANLTSNTATVIITVSGAANPNIAPTLVNDSDNTLTNQVVYTNVLINDSDPNNDVLTVNITAAGLLAPSNGTIQLMPNKLIKYTPNAGFYGTDTYQYQVCDTHPSCSGSSSLCSVALVTIKVVPLPITLSGKLWLDADKSGTPTFTNIPTGTETGTNGTGGIYVYLIDSTNTIIDRSVIDNDGTYSLSNVPSLTSNLKLIVSNEELSIGNTLTTGSLPNGYSNTSPLTRALPTTGTTALTGNDFGIYINSILSPGTIVAPGSVCPTITPSAITSSVNANGGSITATGYSYQWQSSTDSVNFTNISGATSKTYTPTSAIPVKTYYRRAVTSVDGSNNIIDGAAYSNIVSIALYALPTVTAGSNSPVCIGSPLALTATSGMSSYTWAGPNSFSSSIQNPAVNSVSTTAMAGTYTLTVTDANGCIKTVSTSVTINPLPTVAVNPTALSVNIGSSAILTASGASTYSWIPTTNLSASSGTTVTVTGTTVGTSITYTATGTDINGCKNTATTVVTFTNVPPLVPGTIGIQGGTTILAKNYCTSANGVVIIPTSLNTGGTSAYVYQWQSSTDNVNFTDIVGSTDSTYTSGNITSSLYVRRQVTSGSKIKFSNSVYIQIYPAPVKPVISGTATQIVGKASVTLTSTAATSYLWSTAETTRSIVTPAGGNYTVTITDANGCTSVSSAYTITTLDPYKVADLQKVVSKAPVLQSDGTFILGFTFLLSNLRSELMDSVKMKDDLTKVFPATVDFQVTQIKASGNLKANALYNGNSQIDLLSDVSQLPGLTKDSVQLYLKVNPNGFSGKLLNQVVLTANSPFGQFSVTSNDPTVSNSISVRNPTPFDIPLIDIFIPSGFSPNHDGVNDNFVIIRPFGTTINMEIFNRWGNAVYKAPDYKNEWDGRGNQPNNILGEMLPDGTYYYIVTATDKLTGNIRKFAGFVTLKR